MENGSKTISEDIIITGMNIKKYQIPQPYPKVKTDKEDKKYLKIIFQDYSSRDGELTAACQYVYAHVASHNNSEISKQASDAFEGIGIIEMFHLEMLGDLIKDLGGDPRYINEKDIPWKSSYVLYGKNLKENLKNAVKIEETAINNYENHIKLIDSKEIKKLYKRIIIDEKLHLDIFTKLLKKLSRT